jgi:hypothetical protein
MPHRRARNPEFNSRFVTDAVNGLKKIVALFAESLPQALASLPIPISV